MTTKKKRVTQDKKGAVVPPFVPDAGAQVHSAAELWAAMRVLQRALAGEDDAGDAARLALELAFSAGWIWAAQTHGLPQEERLITQAHRRWAGTLLARRPPEPPPESPPQDRPSAAETLPGGLPEAEG